MDTLFTILGEGSSLSPEDWIIVLRMWLKEVMHGEDPAMGLSHDRSVLTPLAYFFLPRLWRIVNLADV